MTSSELLTLIDDHKEDLPSGLYVKLCNQLKNKHEEETKKSEYDILYVSIKYIYPTLKPDGDGGHIIKLYKESEIIELIRREYDHMVDHWGCSHLSNIKNKLTYCNKLQEISTMYSCDECEEIKHPVTSLLTDVMLVSYSVVKTVPRILVLSGFTPST